MLTKTLAVEWSGRGVTVNAVGPTFVYTPGTAERLDDPAFLNSVLSKIPRGRVATIEDVASAVLYLASDHADMVTGSLLLAGVPHRRSLKKATMSSQGRELFFIYYNI